MAEIKPAPRPRVPMQLSASGTVGFLYQTPVGHSCLKLLTKPAVSRAAGTVLNTAVSRAAIGPFARAHSIDLHRCEKRRFTSYNDFFTRKWKREYLRFSADPAAFCAPCCARLSVYPIEEDSRFFIKGGSYSVAEMLGGDARAERFRGGWCMVFRLAVEDYHRYCYFDDGCQKHTRFLPGVLHTVQPAALQYADIYRQNCREYTALYTAHFGMVMQVEVGALMVGRIANRHRGFHDYTRGEEKGWFEFGGSTVVLLVEPGRMDPDAELVDNTRAGYETGVAIGEQIGRAVQQTRA